MRRRTFIASIGYAATAWPLAARAQQRVPRIGFLGTNKRYLDAVEAGLRDLGYVPGENVIVEFRFSEGRDYVMQQLARELIDLKVDVVITNGNGLHEARDVLSGTPVVVAVGGRLVEDGFAQSLAHPGGNVTGQELFWYELFAKRVDLLKQIQPALASVGVFLLRGAVLNEEMYMFIEAQVRATGVELKPFVVADANEIDFVLSAGSGLSVGALLAPDNPFFLLEPVASKIAATAASRNIVSAGAPSFAKYGGLLGYGIDFPAAWRHAVTFIDKILRGAKPGDIPIEQAAKFITIINLKTARALGAEIPPNLLAAADEVIE